MKNKDDLITKIVVSERITKKEAKDCIDITLKGIINTLKNGEDLRIAGFGTFVVWNREPRTARNLQTQETIEVPEKNYVTFRAGIDTKYAVNLKKALDRARSIKRVKFPRAKLQVAQFETPSKTQKQSAKKKNSKLKLPTQKQF